MKRRLDWLLRSLHVAIVAEDEYWMVLNKPPRLLVLPDRYQSALVNLQSVLTAELAKIFVVHRIDRDTSGLVVFAKTAEVHAGLNRQFEERTVEKTYLALVRGVPSASGGIIELPLGEDAGRPGRMKIDPKRGKPSATRWEVVERFDGFSLLEAHPLTGRTHQIRVHLASVGSPLLCDPLYGDGKPLLLSSIKARYRNEGEEKPMLNRTALHAQRLVLRHPVSGEQLKLEAPLPKDLRSALQALRKYAPGRSGIAEQPFLR
jgi:RluA family pseudouridine synthase